MGIAKNCWEWNTRCVPGTLLIRKPEAVVICMRKERSPAVTIAGHKQSSRHQLLIWIVANTCTTVCCTLSCQRRSLRETISTSAQSHTRGTWESSCSMTLFPWLMPGSCWPYDSWSCHADLVGLRRPVLQSSGLLAGVMF